jgi:hypothetical protein
MAWCDQAGLHPEIPVGHDHDHDHDEAHERVAVDLVLVGDGMELAMPVADSLAENTPLETDVVVASRSERTGEPPGLLSTVRLL